MFKNKKNELTPSQQEEMRIKDFFDRVIPSVIRFFPDYFISANSYQCVWAIREYPPTTEEQAILAHLADRNNVVIRVGTIKV